MKHPSLHELLTELHNQLLAARSLDPKDRDLLRDLVDDIRAVTKGAPGSAPPEQSGELRQRLVDAVAAFEASHPQVSKTLATVIDTLAFYNI
jgi:hypothetical protein